MQLLLFCLISSLVLLSQSLPAQQTHARRLNPAAHNSASAKRQQQTGIDKTLRQAIETAPKAEQWPNNDYVQLLDTADVTIKSDGTMIARYRQTYKLFNSRARDLAEVNLPYNSSYQRLHVISARTIQEDGTILTVSPAEFRPRPQYSDYLLYDDARGIGFSLPGIANNCIIDYSWEEVTRPLLMPGQFSLAWSFSGPCPVECNRLTLHYPAREPIHVTVHNTEFHRPRVFSKIQGETVTAVWEATHLCPLPEEPMMPIWDEVTSRVEITSLSSWQDIARWYWQLQHPQAAPTPKLKARAARLTAGLTTPEAKARALYDWVSRSVRYVGLEFGLSAIKPHSATTVATNLYGDCKDKATLLIALLGEAGIKAYPTLLDTEMHQVRDRKLPAMDAFDHCIACAEVNGKSVWLDATAETCAYGDIPAMDRGAQALVIRNGAGEWQTIPDFAPGESGEDAGLQVALHPDGSAQLTVELAWRGRAKQEMQEMLADLSPDRREDMLKKMAATLSVGAVLTRGTCLESHSDAEPVRIHLECVAPHWAKRVGDLLLLPVANALATPARGKFTEEERAWPIVQMNATMLRANTRIALPADASIEGLPAEIKEGGPFQQCERHFQHAADGRSLSIQMNYRERAGSLPKERYPELRNYYAAMALWNEDQIVLHIGHK
jgi:transglutaminase-like putative cysteine protease